MPVWGHIALIPTREAVALGQDGIEHLRGSGWYSLGSDLLPDPVPRRLTGMRREGVAWWDATEAGIQSLARDLADRGTQLDPTLTVMSYLGQRNPRIGESVRDRLPPWVVTAWDKSRSEGATAQWGEEDFRAFSDAATNQRRFVHAFRAAGGLVSTGSDIGVELVVPGLSIHQEIAELVAAGLTPLEALRAATSDAARAARIEDLAGRLDVGGWGNAVILERDPLNNIEDTRAIRAVVNRGTVVPRGN
jgi:imidazolonepropionase-like amidohydrolase